MYNFKKDARLYVYIDNVLFPIDIYPDLNFSQTYSEQAQPKKTLHNNLALNKGATITEINTGNINFTVPIKYATGITPLASIFGVDYASGTIEPVTIYVSFNNAIFKLNSVVIESLVYNIDRVSIPTISVSGSFSLLETVPSLPSAITIQPENTDPYVIIRGTEITVDGSILDSVVGINIEVNNSIEWTRNNTLHKVLNNSISYKDSYVLTERRVSGSITEYLLDTTIGSNYSTAGTINIKLYSEIGQDPPFLTFDLPEVVYTRRTDIGDLLTRVYDFRLTDNNLLILPEV